jgi:hypothetical protein
MGLSIAHSGLASRPNESGPVTYTKNWKSTGNQWFGIGPFSQPAAGYYGNVGNGTLRGPGLVNFNMAAYKTFGLFEGVNLQFRAEFFNVFNHTNPNDPSASLGNGNFGMITSYKDPRVGELAMKFNF